MALWILSPIFLALACWAVWQVTLHHSFPVLPSLPQSQPELNKQSTGDVAFTVNAGGAYYYKFQVPSGASGVRLQGHFVATGGIGNDVEVYVFSEDDYVNPKNGHSTKTFYNSGKVTQGTLDVPLPSNDGTYYVVFDNAFSMLTPKALQANVGVRYFTQADAVRSAK